MRLSGLMAVTVAGLAAVLASPAAASYWSISGATAGGVSPGGGRFDLYTQVTQYFTANHGPGGNPQGSSNLTQGEAGGILGAASLSLAANTLTYFGWVDSANRGYMAVAYQNTGSTAFSAFISGNNWSRGSQGLFSTHAIGFVSSGSASNISVAGGTTFLMVMGGYQSGDPQITFNLGSANSNFGVEYLSYDSVLGQYVVEASGTGTPQAGSGMNVASYTAEAMINFGPVTTAVPGGGAMAIAVAASGLAGTLRRRRSAD